MTKITSAWFNKSVLEESAQQIVTSNLENRKLRPERLSLDKIGAVRASFSAILLSAFFPGLVRLGASLVELQYPLRPGGLFLIFFAGAFAFSWQLASSASVVVKYLRGERGNASQHVSFGFSALPKVLLSHSILILSLFFLFPASGEGGDFPSFVRSLLLVIVSVGFFLSWAPAFVSGEFFTKPLPQVEEEDEDFESVKTSFPKPKFFSGMGIVDLGIERSFYFCINNFGLTVALLLVGCCVKVIPAAIGIAFFGHSSSYGSVIVESILSSIAIGVAMVMLGMSFLGSLPKEARAELELLDDSVIAVPSAVLEKSRLLGKVFVALLSAASVLATFFLIQTIKIEQSFPLASVPQFVAERTANTIVIRFELEDKVNAFRWLDSERFRLEVPKSKEELALAEAESKSVATDLKSPTSVEPKKGGVLEALQHKLAEAPKNETSNEVGKLNPDEDSKFKLLSPREVLFYSESGELIDDKFFKPYFGKIKVTLTFDYKSNAANDFNLESSISPQMNEQKLLYLLIGESAQVLAKFHSEQPQ